MRVKFWYAVYSILDIPANWARNRWGAAMAAIGQRAF